uniref:Uncharacterized protein n=1 Tax=Sphaerodactylus townsendi TaxID=933632 RepID=A0ACB8F002_9SAUR
MTTGEVGSEAKRGRVEEATGKQNEGSVVHGRSRGRAGSAAEPDQLGSEWPQLGRGRDLRARKAFKAGSNDTRELPLNRGAGKGLAGGSGKVEGVAGLSWVGRPKTAQPGERTLAQVRLVTEVIVGSRETLVILAKKAWMEREESLDSKGYQGIQDQQGNRGQKDPKASRVRKESKDCGAPLAAEARRSSVTQVPLCPQGLVGLPGPRGVVGRQGQEGASGIDGIPGKDGSAGLKVMGDTSLVSEASKSDLSRWLKVIIDMTYRENKAMTGKKARQECLGKEGTRECLVSRELRAPQDSRGKVDYLDRQACWGSEDHQVEWGSPEAPESPDQRDNQ